MARLSPTTETLRSLFAKSGNICAFPGCTKHLLDEKNRFVGQICHIEAAEQGGERFRADMTDEERRSHNNLIIMCYEHHVVTDDVKIYTVPVLLKFKSEHEAKYGIKPFKIDEAHLHKLALEMDTYWASIDEVYLQIQKDHGSSPNVGALQDSASRNRLLL